MKNLGIEKAKNQAKMLHFCIIALCSHFHACMHDVRGSENKFATNRPSAASCSTPQRANHILIMVLCVWEKGKERKRAVPEKRGARGEKDKKTHPPPRQKDNHV